MNENETYNPDIVTVEDDEISTIGTPYETGDEEY